MESTTLVLPSTPVRDLAAIEDKLGDLGKEAERLASEHPEQSDAIKGRLAEITGVWDEMKVGDDTIRSG